MARYDQDAGRGAAGFVGGGGAIPGGAAASRRTWEEGEKGDPCSNLAVLAGKTAAGIPTLPNEFLEQAKQEKGAIVKQGGSKSSRNDDDVANKQPDLRPRNSHSPLSRCSRRTSIVCVPRC